MILTLTGVRWQFLIQSWTVFENIYRGYFWYKWGNLNMDQIIENINVLLNSFGWDNAIVVLLDNVFATYVQKVQEKKCVCVCVCRCLSLETDEIKSAWQNVCKCWIQVKGMQVFTVLFFQLLWRLEIAQDKNFAKIHLVYKPNYIHTGSVIG